MCVLHGRPLKAMVVTTHDDYHSYTFHFTYVMPVTLPTSVSAIG